MTQTQVIDALRNELFDDEWVRKDFEKYDVPKIKASREPFLWLEYGGCTHLTMCGAWSISQLFATEAKRMAMFREPNEPIGAIEYVFGLKRPEYKCFYWSGYKLERVTTDAALQIWHCLVESALGKARDEHKDEYECCNIQLQLKFSEATEDVFYKELKLAEEMGDRSLTDCITRLRCRRRMAINHYIQISLDFADHSFYFTEMVNDEFQSNGGIIADFERTKNRWSIHT